MKVMVTGATGYIGGRLVPRLLEQGHDVRILARNPDRLIGRPWIGKVSVAQGDLLEPETLQGAFDGIDAAFYLVHSMCAGADFVELDRRAAENLCQAAPDLRHVIYLGGLLAEEGGDSRVSEHLSSRAEAGSILARNLPTTELRAGPIIGSGSASFEMLRYLVERVPVMLAPTWVSNPVCPIAVRDVLRYLELALTRGPCGIVEIGSERVTYAQMAQGYARVRRLKRFMVPIPSVFASRFGAGWVGRLTPIPEALARPLIESIAKPLYADLRKARDLFPEVEPLGYEDALKLALQRIRERRVETRWSDSIGGTPAREHMDSEGFVREVRSVHVEAPPEEVFRVIAGLGEHRGWMAWNRAWRMRGAIDRVFGGPGPRPDRSRPEELRVGDAVDSWCVELVSPPRLLRLRANMTRPGRAWLQWEASPESHGTRLIQTEAFAPRGLPGALYIWVFQPVHRVVLTEMVRAIARRATRGQRGVSTKRVRRADVTASSTRSPARREASPPTPPTRTYNVFGDVLTFLLRRPAIPTLVEIKSPDGREAYRHRIMQRLGIDVTRYSVLNLHRIGIEAPGRYVFEEVLGWNGDSSCWPNQIARTERPDGDLEEIRIRPLGLGRLPFGRNARFGWDVPPLFRMSALKIQHSPGDSDPDNARYVLYACSGGYPIGIFTLYVRSSIPGEQETAQTQVFLGVGFDFYGKKKLSRIRLLSWIWEIIHNRVTANVLNRFKRLCEWRFARTQAGR